MAAWLLDFRPRQCRPFHISDGGFAPAIFTDIQPKTVASEYILDLFFFWQIILFYTGDVVKTTPKRIAATDFSNHNLGLIFIETVDDSVKPSKDPHRLVSDTPAFPGIAGLGNLVDVVPLPQQFSEQLLLLRRYTLYNLGAENTVASKSREAGVTCFLMRLRAIARSLQENFMLFTRVRMSITSLLSYPEYGSDLSFFLMLITMIK